MEKELTPAEKFIQAAEWLKKQDAEFTKHFKGSRSIMEVWNKLPGDYNKSRKKLTNFIKENGKRWDVRQLAMFINVKFGFRYFDNVPKEYSLRFGLNEYRSGKYYVKMNYTNNWTDISGSCSIDIKDVGNAKEAYQKLLENHVGRYGADYEIASIGSRLKDAMKKQPSVKEEMNVGYHIYI